MGYGVYNVTATWFSTAAFCKKESATITTFQADADGEIRLDGVMAYHAILVSIYARSKSSMRLLGNAAIPGEKFVDGGFDGELQLHLRGKMVPEVHVKVSISPVLSRQAAVQRGRSSIRLTVQGNNVMSLEGELEQELEDCGIAFDDECSSNVKACELACELAGINFEPLENEPSLAEMTADDDFQRKCSELGIVFTSDEEPDASEDLRVRGVPQDDLVTVAVMPCT